MLISQGTVGRPQAPSQIDAVQDSAEPDAAPVPGADGTALTPGQVAGRLGGQIIASYPNHGPAAPVGYGQPDAATVLMARGHRVALRDGTYYVDGAAATVLSI